ncbi:peroxide stress protein YaaA [Bizionia sediminis]|uniref:UPF0246 protein ACFSQP_12205 n=1 Tax=Bizionia sediminis TaxID=1737064 RepID=A0ABW5KYI4_9FLAO
MKLLISPAKSLDYETKVPTTKHTEAVFLNEAERLNSVLKTKSAKDLSELMAISANLGQLNYERNQEWALPFNTKTARQAIYAFNGDVYRGLDAYTIPADKIETMQQTVRILSGLYGVLKPLDLILPYRLEMGTKLGVDENKNLYEFWKTKITDALNAELEDDDILLNLASNEYFKAVNTKELKVPVVQIDFKEYKNETYKTIAVYAKAARGLMARFVIDTQAKNLDDIKAFNLDGYGLSDALSSKNKLVFTR